MIEVTEQTYLKMQKNYRAHLNKDVPDLSVGDKVGIMVDYLPVGFTSAKLFPTKEQRLLEVEEFESLVNSIYSIVQATIAMVPSYRPSSKSLQSALHAQSENGPHIRSFQNMLITSLFSRHGLDLTRTCQSNLRPTSLQGPP